MRSSLVVLIEKFSLSNAISVDVVTRSCREAAGNGDLFFFLNILRNLATTQVMAVIKEINAVQCRSGGAKIKLSRQMSSRVRSVVGVSIVSISAAETRILFSGRCRDMYSLSADWP